jgi:hypothetical protein
MLQIQFKLIDINGVPVISLPKEFELIEVLIGTELQDEHEDGIWLLDSLDEVLTEKVDYTNVGDVKYVILTLTKQIVNIQDPYCEEGVYCEIPTESFRNLIIAWLKEKDKFYKTRKKLS